LFARLLRGQGERLDEWTVAELRRLRLLYEDLFHVDATTGEVFLFRMGFAEATDRRSSAATLTRF
jgi:hypothetical protein